MKNKIKFITIFVLLIVSIQTVTFYVFGKKSLAYQYFDKIDNNNVYAGSIGVFDNMYSEKEKVEMKKRLLKRYKSVHFESDNKFYFDRYRLSENYGGLSIEIIYTFPFKAEIQENFGGYQYGELWNTKFAWCIFKSIRYDHICIGQS